MYIGYGHIFAPLIVIMFIISNSQYVHAYKYMPIILMAAELYLWHLNYESQAYWVFFFLIFFVLFLPSGVLDGTSGQVKRRSNIENYESEIRRIVFRNCPDRTSLISTWLKKYKGREDW